MDSVQMDKDRFMMMAEDYDQMAPYLLPQYAFLQDEMIRQSGVQSMEGARVIDLGAGSGLLVEKILDCNVTTTCYWVDSSPAFMAVARRRLDRFGDRVQFILSDREDAWFSRLDQHVDCIFSMSSIHHLESHGKCALYRRSFDMLRPGGWFINTDEAKTLYDDAYLASLLHWAAHVESIAVSVPAELRIHYNRWTQHFTRWKQRNIEAVHAPKSRGDDMHEPFTLQLAWLKEIGFVGVDAFVKYHLWCMMGGRKPVA